MCLTTAASHVPGQQYCLGSLPASPRACYGHSEPLLQPPWHDQTRWEPGVPYLASLSARRPVGLSHHVLSRASARCECWGNGRQMWHLGPAPGVSEREKYPELPGSPQHAAHTETPPPNAVVRATSCSDLTTVSRGHFWALGPLFTVGQCPQGPGAGWHHVVPARLWHLLGAGSC